MKKELEVLEHPMVRYLIIGVFGLGAAVLLFKIGGSLAELTGHDENWLGISFKAGGVFAGFLLVFLLSPRVIEKLHASQKQSQSMTLKIHLKGKPKFEQGISYDCTYSVYNDEKGVTTEFAAAASWEAGYLTIIARDVGADDWIAVQIKWSGKTWLSNRFHVRSAVVEIAQIP